MRHTKLKLHRPPSCISVGRRDGASGVRVHSSLMMGWLEQKWSITEHGEGSARRHISQSQNWVEYVALGLESTQEKQTGQHGPKSGINWANCYLCHKGMTKMRWKSWSIERIIGVIIISEVKGRASLTKNVCFEAFLATQNFMRAIFYNDPINSDELASSSEWPTSLKLQRAKGHWVRSGAVKLIFKGVSVWQWTRLRLISL